MRRGERSPRLDDMSTTSADSDPVPADRAPESSALVEANVVKTYGPLAPGEVAPLGGVSVVVPPGESVAIMGPSGSGKTTLLHVLAGILTATGGSVTWRGRDLARMSDRERSVLRRREFGFVFQAGQLLPELPAAENVAVPLMLAGRARSAAVAAATALFPLLGLQGLERRRPGELSDGQAQRVAITRAMVARPGVVFADEPTGALDQGTSADVMRHLTAVTRRSGAALVVVTTTPRSRSGVTGSYGCGTASSRSRGERGAASLVGAASGGRTREPSAGRARGGRLRRRHRRPAGLRRRAVGLPGARRRGGHGQRELLRHAGPGRLRGHGRPGAHPRWRRVPARRVRRDQRLATLRLSGATSGQVVLMTLAEAVGQALLGGLLGTALYAAVLPLLAQLSFQGRPFAVGELWVGVSVALAGIGAVALLAAVSGLVGLTRVVIGPLGVTARVSPPRLRWWRALAVVVALVLWLAVSGVRPTWAWASCWRSWCASWRPSSSSGRTSSCCWGS
jgi:putative ABC transport system ATP-binding protein